MRLELPAELDDERDVEVGTTLEATMTLELEGDGDMVLSDGVVTQRINFERRLRLDRVLKALGGDAKVFLVHRQDFWEDDSGPSHTYYLELTEEQYKAMGGKAQ